MLNLRDIPVANFPDGHKHLIVPDDFEIGASRTIKASITSFDDLFLLAQAREIFPKLDDLYINYLLAARCDRRFSDGEASDLEIVAKFINGLAFKSITVLRPHSSVANELIANMWEADLTPALLSDCERGEDLAITARPWRDTYRPHGLVIPDKGASTWVGEFASETRIPIQCNKERDMSAEHRGISRIVVPELPQEVKDYIIVDDLCDGGGTFLGIASQLREKGADRVFLVVTHAIFSKGLEVFDGLIDRIYCTNSFADFQHDKIRQINVQ